MIINTKQILQDEKGKPLKDPEGKVITVGSCVCNVLSYQVNKDPFKAYSIAMKFSRKSSVNVKAEDITFIKETFTNAMGLAPITSGQIIAILDGEEITPVEEEEVEEQPVAAPKAEVTRNSKKK